MSQIVKLKGGIGAVRLLGSTTGRLPVAHGMARPISGNGTKTAGSGDDEAGKRRRLAAVAAGGALVLVGGWLLVRERSDDWDGKSVEKTVTVQKSADDLHELWRDPESLTRIMDHFADVTPAGTDRQHWEVHGPTDRSVSWDAEIVSDRPGDLLRWRSVEGADIPNEGTIRFRDAPEDRGTEVTLTISFDPPGGAFGDAVSEYLGILPETLTKQALRRFKSLAETGEIPTLEGNPSARGRGDAV
ncbi:SRPBCC family protein [Haladaptatus sp. CMAA 1911]|uniref:SRPBCC family protein n=1 Tax=unclassified Haladaptatus TaxID=2622732 RepID=UPI003754C30A